MKVIFLDMDGVLNTQANWGKRGAEALTPELVKRVSDLADRTGAVVVITSTWRVIHPLPTLQAWLTLNGFRDRTLIIGATPDFARFGQKRQDEIADWLHHVYVDKWVVLDDDTIGDNEWDKVSGHFVKVDSRVGLSEENVKEAELILED